ncbi:hypothetical protein K435DRAFT_76403 [Dendrothele bispora CBS 962.96]|uniref:Uncharacterized protein n=1 Tax=Dendrothele bispora (strain CBS 962.96) TaxID=1314807 RepID=A0A4S8MS85_DENBC|nr:hypothetical protein K435DRAFT_76403 [Dendrothele bispora CBS 962.96]
MFWVDRTSTRLVQIRNFELLNLNYLNLRVSCNIRTRVRDCHTVLSLLYLVLGSIDQTYAFSAFHQLVNQVHSLVMTTQQFLLLADPCRPPDQVSACRHTLRTRHALSPLPALRRNETQCGCRTLVWNSRGAWPRFFVLESFHLASFTTCIGSRAFDRLNS